MSLVLPALSRVCRVAHSGRRNEQRQRQRWPAASRRRARLRSLRPCPGPLALSLSLSLRMLSVVVVVTILVHFSLHSSNWSLPTTQHWVFFTECYTVWNVIDAMRRMQITRWRGAAEAEAERAAMRVQRLRWRRPSTPPLLPACLIPSPSYSIPLLPPCTSFLFFDSLFLITLFMCIRLLRSLIAEK
jgi:hypothetical protein